VLAAAIVVLAIAASVLLAVVAQRQAHPQRGQRRPQGRDRGRQDGDGGDPHLRLPPPGCGLRGCRTWPHQEVPGQLRRNHRDVVVPLAQKTRTRSRRRRLLRAGDLGEHQLGPDPGLRDQTVQNNLLKATSRLDRSVIEVSMVKVSGHWLVDNLQTVLGHTRVDMGDSFKNLNRISA